jgi:light-regulated signal transduction histidine kinase (bacteriophytochrome)
VAPTPNPGIINHTLSGVSCASRTTACTAAGYYYSRHATFRTLVESGPAAGPQHPTDTGTGIPADELPRIFERFWRGRQASRTAGSGIGLAVASELTRAHGGELTATSSEGHGTQMTLVLPCP